MESKKINPLAQQSREWIRESLFQLMEEGEYSRITISEITAHARLSRRTFYRNFATKEDVISYYFETLCGQYIDLLGEEESLTLPNITRVFFSFWLRHKEFLKLMDKNHLCPLLLEQFNEKLPSIYDLFKGRSEGYADEEEIKFVLFYSIGGYWNTLLLWLKEGAKKEPRELAEMIERAVLLNARHLDN
ncbi:MAG: TetR/AcrR family transcriptional regulator [Spirochaetales bacterium]|nr:TetR/AcrR family transcriptional regulator [Spirochaetales bacterium]